MNANNQGLIQKIIAAVNGLSQVDQTEDRNIREENDFYAGYDKGNEFGRDHGYLDGYANSFGETKIVANLASVSSRNYLDGHRNGYDHGYDCGFIRGQNDRQHDYDFVSV